MKDDSGQFIVLSAFIIALGLIVLTTMLNGVIYSENSAYEGYMNMPDNGVKYLNQLTCVETNNAYYYANSSGSFNLTNYSSYMNSYAQDVSLIYALNGHSVQITDSSFDLNKRMANASIRYADVDTVYQNNASTSIAPKSLSNSLMTPIPGTPTAIGVVVGDTYLINGSVNVTRSTTVPFTVTVIDSSGHEISACHIQIYVSATNGTVSPATQPQLTNSYGYVSYTLSNNDMPGVSTVKVTSSGLMSATFHVKFY